VKMGGAGVDKKRFRTLSEFSQISKNKKKTKTYNHICCTKKPNVNSVFLPTLGVSRGIHGTIGPWCHVVRKLHM
jgi:hypothetical protein